MAQLRTLSSVVVSIVSAILLLLPGTSLHAQYVDTEKTEQPLKELLLKLHDPSAREKSAVLMELAQRGGLRIVPVLTTFAIGDEPKLRTGAIAALGLIPNPGVADFLKRLALSSRTDLVDREGVVRALAEHGNQWAADMLYDLSSALPGRAGVLAGQLAAEKFPERTAFRKGLEEGRVDAAPEQENDAELAELLVHLFDPVLTQRRSRAALALAALGDQRCVPALEAAVVGSRGRVRTAALTALGVLPCPASSHVLARAMASRNLSRDEKNLAIQSLMLHRSTLSATLLLEYSLETGHEYEADVQTYVETMLPVRSVARTTSQSSPGAEVELLVDLLQGHSKRRRTLAIARAGELQAGILPALTARMRDPTVASLAITAVGRYDSAAAHNELGRFAADRSHPMPLRHQAAVALANRKNEKAGALLLKVHNRSTDEDFKEVVARLLTEHYPELARQSGTERIDKDRSGLVPMMLGCGVHGAVSMALISDVANPGQDKTIFLPVLGGAILGAGAPLLLTLDEEVHTSESVWVTTGGFWGLTDGLLLALALSGDGDGDFDRGLRWAEGFSLVGQLGGLAGSWLTRETLGRDPGMVGYMNSAAGMGTLGGLGLALMIEDPEPSTLGGLMLVGNVGSVLAAGVLGDTMRYSGQDYAQTASTMAMSTWAGGWLAEAANFEADTATIGGSLAGAALGFAGSSIIAAYTEPDYGMTGFLDLAFIAGNLGGLGIGMQWEDLSDGEAGAWMVGGGAASLVAAGTLGSDFKFSGDDNFQALSSTGLGAWTGYWGLSALRPDHDAAAGGGLLLGAALGFGTGSVLAAYRDTPAAQMTRHLGAFGTGSAFGAGLGLVVPGLEPRYAEAFSLLGGWGALSFSAALDEAVAYSDGDLALLTLGGTWGLWHGFALWKAGDGDDDSVLAGAALLGASTGLISSAALSQFVDWDAPRVGRAATGGTVGTVIGHGMGLLIPELEDSGLWSLALAGGWAGLLVEGLYVPPSEFTSGDYAALVAGPLWGLAQGALIGNSAGFTDDRLQGAMMVGAGIGYLSGEAFARAGNLQFKQVLFTELSSYSGTGLGAGLVLVAEGGSKTVTTVSSLTGWGAKFATGFFADKMEFRGDDAWEYLMGQGFGMWQGAGYASYAGGSDGQLGGAMLLGMSTGFFLPMLTNQLHDFSSWDDFLIFGGAAWGTWLGGWLPYAASSDDQSGMENDPRLLAALIGGDVGLVAAGLALSPLLDVSPVVVGWTELIGLGGMALGASGTAIFANSNEVIATGQIVGSVLGLVGGAILGMALDDGTSEDIARASAAAGDDSSRSPLRIGRFELPLFRPATFIAPPPAGTGSAPVILVGLETPLR